MHKLCGFSFSSFILFIIPFLFSGCSVQEPSVPSWNVPVTVPLSQQTFRLGDYLLNDSTIVARGADSLIFLDFKGNLDTVRVNEEVLRLPAQDTSQAFALGEIQLDALTSLNSGFQTLGELMPDLQNLVGQPVPFTVPETTLTPAPQVLNSPDFDKALLASGRIQVRFFNNLPFPLGPNASTPDGMHLTVYDNQNQKVVEFVVSQVVNPGDQVVRESALPQNRWIQQPFRIEYTLPVAQSTSFLVTSDLLNSAGFSLELQFRQLRALEIVADIPAQQVSRQTSFAIPGKNRLKWGKLEQGSLVLNFNNQLPVGLTLNFTIPFLLGAEKQPISRQVVLPAASQQAVTIDLSNAEFTNPQSPGAYLDSVTVEYQVSTQPSSGMVHLKHTDQVAVAIHSDPLVLAGFSGYLAGDTLAMAPIVVRDIADYQGLDPDVQFQQVSLDFSLHSEVNVENLILKLHLVGYHEEQGVVTDSSLLVLADQPITPGQPGQPGTTTFTLTGADLANFLSILPTSIKASGQVQVGGNTEITKGSRLWGDYHFSTPLKVQIQHVAPFEADPTVIEPNDIDQQVRDASENDLSEATLSLQVENHTPLGGSVRIIITADPTAVDPYDLDHLNPDLTIVKDVSLAAAPVDPTTGYVNQSAMNPIELSLDAREIALFAHPPLKVGYLLQIDDTAQPVAVRANDYVRLAGMVRIVYNVNSNN
ncbi:MAG: hypothetical protein D6715_12800 [Calditrichaeota bacterium]|nr:MAG: hypothetical protein D6715_12800 [Calditrichota bacterium]